MRVLLAGGGTAGHTSPLLATADALRRLDPDVEITCLGTPRGLETRVVPEAGYPLELIPPVPLPRAPNADLLEVPGRLRGAVKRDARGPRPGPARRGRRLRRLRLGAGLPRRPPAQAAARRPRAATPCRASPTRLGARIAAPVAVSFPDTPLPHADVRRAADPPDDLRRSTGPRCAPRRGAFFGLDRRPADAAGDRRLPGRPPASTSGRPAPPRRSPTPASRCCTSSGRRARPSARARPACPTSCCVRRPDGPRLRRRRPGGLPRRRQQRHRGRRPSGCRRSSCRCRSATASRRSTPGRSSTPAAGCWSPTPR